MRPPCADSCKKKCNTREDRITEEDRKLIFSEFWAVANIDLQRNHIVNRGKSRPKDRTKPKYPDELETKIPQRLNDYHLKANETKPERYQIPKPPPPPPPKPTMETLIQHKDDKPLWSELDWLTNFKPPVTDKTPDWRNCKLLDSKLDTEQNVDEYYNILHISLWQPFKCNIISH